MSANKAKQDRSFQDVFLSSPCSDVCPVDALLQYLTVRNSSPGPLFILQSGTPLTRTYLVTHLQSALQQAGLDQSQYNGHSFRIGAATTAAQQGIGDAMIQTLGRWRSDAYKVYIKLPQAQLAAISKKLVQRK